MRIYAAIASWELEGSELIGVFDSPEKAQAACDGFRYENGDPRGDFRDVVEYQLNEVALDI